MLCYSVLTTWTYLYDFSSFWEKKNAPIIVLHILHSTFLKKRTNLIVQTDHSDFRHLHNTIILYFLPNYCTLYRVIYDKCFNDCQLYFIFSVVNVMCSTTRTFKLPKILKHGQIHSFIFWDTIQKPGMSNNH